MSNSSKKEKYSKKIKHSKKKNVKINTKNKNNNVNNTNHTNNTNNTNNTNHSKYENDKNDLNNNINNTYNKIKNNNQSYSYNRNNIYSLTEEELKILCLNEKLNDKGLPELITELAGLENKMNQDIQKIKEVYEPIIKQHKEGIKFLKQNPFLKNLKEYENFENFKKKMKINMDDMENRSISSSVHNLNKIKISFYRANDIEEINISANKHMFDKTGYGHHDMMKI